MLSYKCVETHRLVEQVDAEELPVALVIGPVANVGLLRDAGLDGPPAWYRGQRVGSISPLEVSRTELTCCCRE